MPFSTRNALYLRISSWTVLLLYLYLDERHVEWMTDPTLQLVLEDLRPKLITKLQAEDPSKKSQVEVHRGDTYQFAFFFRKTDSRHVVLLKKREYHLKQIRPPPSPPTIPITTTRPRPQKRTRSDRDRSTSTALGGSGQTGDAIEFRNGKRQRVGARAGRAGSVSLSERDGEGLVSDDEDGNEDGSNEAGLAEPDGSTQQRNRRSERSISRMVDYSEDDDGFGREDTPLQSIRPEDAASDDVHVKLEPMDDPPFALGSGIGGRTRQEGEEALFGPDDDEDEDEEDEEREEDYVMRDPAAEEGTDGEEVDDKKELKPEMRLSYTGFSIASRQLVLIIEPFPALPTDTIPRSTSARPRSTFSRATSREMHLHRFGTADSSASSDFGLMTPSDRGGGGGRDQSQTPLLSVPNSRRGGTATSVIGATPTPAPGGEEEEVSPGGGPIGAAAIAAGINANSSRDASVANRRSETPLMMNSRYTASLRNTPRETPDFGHGGDGYSAMDPPNSRNRDRTPLFGRDTPFEDVEPDDVDEEDDNWRRDARASSWAPFRGGSAAPDLDEVDDDEDDELMNEARGVLAMSQSLQSNTDLRKGNGSRANGEGDDGDFADGDGEDVGDGVGGPD